MITGFAGKYADFLVEYPTVFGLVVTGFVMVGQCIPFGDVHLDGRMEIDFQDIFSGFQLLLRSVFHSLEHVGRFQHFFFVQILGRISVESSSNTRSTSCFFGSQLERRFSADRSFPYLSTAIHRVRVEAEEGIFDDLVVHQVGAHHPGPVAGCELLSWGSNG